MITLGVLHPGQMGVSLAAAAKAGGARVLWASAGRSERTLARARSAGLEDGLTLAELARACNVVLSICPPHGALAQAEAVAATGFSGLYCDANAISPALTRRVEAAVEAAGARFVDGGVVGPPALKPGTTRLYLSGERAGEVASIFNGSMAEPVVLDERIGAASALKMAYAGWTKGRAALLLGVCALARAEGADAALFAEWARSQPGLQDDAERSTARVAPKAWRWVGEMEEIAGTFAAAGLPDGFHRAAAELYAAMAGFKDAPEAPALDALLNAVLQGGADGDVDGNTGEG